MNGQRKRKRGNTKSDYFQNGQPRFKSNKRGINENNNNNSSVCGNNRRDFIACDEYSNDDIVYNELYNENYCQYHWNEQKEEEFQNYNLEGINKHNICKFYNPYFCSGCQYGRYCQFRHLSESEFLKYCRYSNALNIDLFASNIFSKSLKHIQNGKIKKAYLILRKLVLDYELNGLFNFWLGRCHHLFPNATNEDMNTAQYYYRKAIAISPSNSSFHSHYAQFSVEWAKRLKLRVRCSEYKQAKDHFKKSLKLRKTPIVHFMFAKFLDEVENEYFDAVYHYKCAISAFNNDTRLRLNYARCLHKMKKYKLSKKQFQIIFNIYKNQRRTCTLWPHFHFAKLLIDMQFYQQSTEQFLHCINLMNKLNHKYFSEIYYEFAKLLNCYLNQYKSAFYYINIAIEISPSRKYYKKILYQIQDKLKNANNDIQQDNTQKKVPLHLSTHLQPQGFNFGHNQYDDEEEEEEDEEKDDEEKTDNHTFSFGGTTFNYNMNENDEHEHESDDCESDCDDAENEFLANRFCATEFDRFISSDISFGDEFEKYCDKFEDEKMNDIRWLLNETKILNDEWLTDKIGMNQESINLWKQSVGIFNNQYERYVQWLKKNNFYNKYFKKFETYGILHLQSFFYHVKNEDDVLYMIGIKNEKDANIIWKSAEKEMDDIMKTINQSIDEQKQSLINL